MRGSTFIARMALPLSVYLFFSEFCSESSEFGCASGTH